jgi:hypothetical protein
LTILRYFHKGFQFLFVNQVIPFKHGNRLVPGSRHDHEIVMAVLPPIVDAGMPAVMEGEIFNPRFFADGLMRPSNVIRINYLPISMEDPITTKRPHPQ